MKFLCIGDPHFKKNNTEETENMEKQILKIIDENELNFVVVLGDILHDFETITSSVQCRAVKFLSKINEKVKLCVLIGNHDRINNKEYLTEVHPFYALKNWENTYIADSPIEFKEKDYNFLLVPYVPNGEFLNAIKNYNYKSKNIIFAHQEFKGCKLGCNISIEGDEWDVKNPLVITGHIHEYQRPQYNIIYTGTPIQHGFSDSKDKTISLYELNDEVLKGTTFKGSDFYVKETRIKIPQKVKRTLRLKCDEIKKFTLKEDSHYKIKIKGTIEELNSVFKDPIIEKWKELGHKVIRDAIIENHADKIYEKELKFEKILFESIKDNDKLIEVYQKYFGKYQ